MFRAARQGVLALGFALVAGAGVAQADWLVLRDGTYVETAGSWRLDGKLVVFERPGGKLASLRLAEVDLAASEAATREAVRLAEEALTVATAAPEPKKKAVLVLTDADIPKGARVDETAEGEGEGDEDGESAAEPSGLEVTSWDSAQSPDGQGLRVSGSVANRTARMATDLGLKVHLYDEEGQLLASRDASITRATLPPGEDTGFIAEFPDVPEFSAAKFEPSFRSFESREVAPADEEAAAAAAAAARQEAEESPPSR